MRFNNVLIILCLLLVAMMCFNSVVAAECNIQDNNVNSSLSNDLATISIDSDNLSSTVTVDNAGENHNEMNEKTIKNAIDSSKDGDVIIISGNKYDQVHQTIDKKLTIRSEVSTTLTPCSSSAESGYHGIFYLTSKASGTVIEGFYFKGNGMLYNSGDYGILIDGASNVIIRNCTFTDIDVGDAIRVVNAKGITIDNVAVDGATNGINIKDSSNTVVINSDIKNNKIAAVSVSGLSNNTKIITNNLTNNDAGVNLASADYVYILNNYIAYNKNGVYVNCNITKIEIKGNFFNQNKNYEVLNDYRVRNMVVNKVGDSDLEIIDNNYMVGLKGAQEERPVFRYIYEYKGPNKGEFTYDSENDVYNPVGKNNGDYTINKGAVFLRYVFEVNKNVNCPVIFYEFNGKQWSLSGNYELKLSEISQVKKGVYSISIVDENGNVAKDLSSVPVTFYLNKDTLQVNPEEGDIYRTVMMVNGTATARFSPDEFRESRNIITAVTPTNGAYFDIKTMKRFNVDDDEVPGILLNTTLTVSDLNTYPNSNEKLIISLKDSNGNPVTGQNVKVKINLKLQSSVTDNNGSAVVNVSIAKEGRYNVEIIYEGDDAGFEPSTAQANVVVKKQSAKIISSNMNMIPKMAEYYSVTLKDDDGNPIAGYKVTFKVNGKKYTKNTNSKGIAKVKLSFSKNKKTYKININFAGDNQYKSASKTNKITVKYSSKTAKLTVPKVTIPPKTSKTYTVTLKDGNGKGIAKQKVTVKINGKTYTKKTNSKGQVSLKVKFSAVKTYKVSASYKGSKIYKKASSTGNIKVAKTATKISAPAVSILPNEANKYVVTLKTSSGKALSKQKVTITLDGKTYTKTTDSKGQVSLPVNFADEKEYSVSVNYKGTAVYKASKSTGKIDVSKLDTVIESYDRTYSKNIQKDYLVALKDILGNPLINKTVNYTLNNTDYSKTTDNNGQIIISLPDEVGLYDIVISYSGDDKYKSASKTSKINVSNDEFIVFVDSDLPNYQIQYILDNAPLWDFVKFLGDYYFDVSLTVNNGMTIYSDAGTILNAPFNRTALTIMADDVSVTNMIVCGNSSDAVDIINANNVNLIKNSIINHLDESKTESYVNGSVNMPGYGVKISNSSGIWLWGNEVSLFESGLFAEYSDGLNIDNNTFSENNYGIKYGLRVSNTKIVNNEIVGQTGLYIMTVPEGPTGYGIFLNNSAVNVTINNNHIAHNHLGISLDANKSTGIVITQNVITDNVLEGIRFNAPYDLAENAVEPIVTDNAIYRNAVGPSMMILGEMSANPEGIYGPGQWDDSLRLKLDPNWYGTNNLITWDYDTGIVGYGTMCPRISTTPIRFYNLTYNDFGNYSVVFYKNGEVASNLPEFDMYATLNRESKKPVEVKFNVVGGVGTFNFNPNDFNKAGNVIEVSVGSLLESTYRTFKITYSYNVPEREIQA